MKEPISLSGIQQATLEVTAHAGDEITRVAERAILAAQQHGEPVRFDFNGDTFVCTEADRAEKVAHLYLDTLHSRRAAYEASPEGLAAAERHRLEVIARQARLDALLPELESQISQGLVPTLHWLSTFTPAADWGGLQYDTGKVADLLSQIAPEGVHVGRTDLKEDLRAMGEWIVGQAISCLRRGMGPHPMTVEFIRRWQDLSPSLKATPMKPVPELYYFGCLSSGHHVYLDRSTVYGVYETIEGGLDTGFLKKAGVRDIQGKGAYVQASGYSILTFWDHSGDPRPGSNSAFFALGEYTADELLAAARERYPHLFKRFNFEISW